MIKTNGCDSHNPTSNIYPNDPSDHCWPCAILVLSSPLFRRHFSHDTMTCWIFGRPSPSFQNTKNKIPRQPSPIKTHLGPSLAPWLYIVLLNSGNGRQMVVLVGGFASRPMTDEMRGRDVRGGACVLFGRVAEPTFKQTRTPERQNATKSSQGTKPRQRR